MYKGDQRLLLFLSEFLFFFAWFPLSPSLVSPHYPLLPIHVNKSVLSHFPPTSHGPTQIYTCRSPHISMHVFYTKKSYYTCFSLNSSRYWSLQASFHGLDPFFQMAVDHSLI